MSLNPAQLAAVAHRDGPLLVLAGAGTGKTRVITQRVASLLDEGVPPWRILAVTFTNKAAGEMRERTAGLSGAEHETRKIWIGTFHSICARILRQHGESLGLSNHFSIYDPGDQQSVMKSVLQSLNVSDKLYSPRGVLTVIDRAKNRGLPPERLEETGVREPMLSVARKAYARYQRRLLAADACDFGDLLVHAVTLLRNSRKPSDSQMADLDPVFRLTQRFSHVLVDEYQDTNPIQAALVDLLSTKADLCVVGDDDQAIYGWRGADVEQILRFPERHEGCEIIRLEQNYRSTTHILDCADAVIRRNLSRHGKTLWSDLGPGSPVRVLMLADERDEARLIAHESVHAIDEDGADPEEIAIFYRTHAQSRVLEDELRRAGLSCRIIGGVAFYERMEVKDVLSYLASMLNPHSDVHLSRIVNRPARKIGATTVRRLADHAARESISLWDAMQTPEAADLKKAAAGRVRGFVTLLKELTALVGTMPLDQLLLEVVERTGYRAALAEDDSEESHARLENLQELSGNLIEFVEERPEATLADYLELVSLVGGERSEGDRGRAVTLMTVHSAKGLEFERVYMTGMEERVFPHARVLEDPVQMEEERRLAYVALTRAKRRLTLTMTRRRMLYGQTQVGSPSRFVLDLPTESTEQIGRDPAPARARPDYGGGPVRRRPAAPTRSADAWQDDIEYDVDPADAADWSGVTTEDEEGEGMSLYVGMWMRHGKFGEGELVGWHGGGKHLKLQLKFPGVGLKTILARFCEPM